MKTLYSHVILCHVISAVFGSLIQRAFSGVFKMPDGKSVISASGLSFRYEGASSDAVGNVNLDISAGDFVCVLGRNGSGKSTFGKLLNALLSPTSGALTVCGQACKTEDDAYMLRRKCGMVFQNPDNQLVATIVEEDVAFGPENLGLPPEEIQSRVEWALKTVGMWEHRKSAPHLLSGGQKQRIAIAGVIAMRPEVIVFDESTSMLDPVGRSEIIRVAKELNKNNGVTVVWITHFMDEAALADRVLVMDSGTVVMDGTPREVFSRVDDIEKYGLESPDTAILARKLRDAGIDIPLGIITVDEMEVELCRLKP